MTVDILVKALDLLPHPEGGFYKETYRSPVKLSPQCLSTDFSGERNIATGIYFLVEKGNFSALHKIKSDETWNFYSGDALEVIEIDEAGNVKTTLIGPDILKGERFQYTVKANTWFGSRVSTNGQFSLVGCTVYPGFDFNDFEMAARSVLIKQFPQHEGIISELTRI
jgi:predicted cupin superfamily sugar epimerase